jgi:hypothetical protein
MGGRRSGARVPLQHCSIKADQPIRRLNHTIIAVSAAVPSPGANPVTMAAVSVLFPEVPGGVIPMSL